MQEKEERRCCESLTTSGGKERGGDRKFILSSRRLVVEVEHLTDLRQCQCVAASHKKVTESTEDRFAHRVAESAEQSSEEMR